MEPATVLAGEPRVFVIPAEVGWSDIGSWAAVYELLAAKSGAQRFRAASFTLDAQATYLWSPKNLSLRSVSTILFSSKRPTRCSSVRANAPRMSEKS